MKSPTTFSAVFSSLSKKSNSLLASLSRNISVRLDKSESWLNMKSMTFETNSDLKDKILFMAILDKCSDRAGGNSGWGAFWDMEHCTDRQLFAGGGWGICGHWDAALENVFTAGAPEKKSEKAEGGTVAIFGNFLFYDFYKIFSITFSEKVSPIVIFGKI